MIDQFQILSHWTLHDKDKLKLEGTQSTFLILDSLARWQMTVGWDEMKEQLKDRKLSTESLEEMGQQDVELMKI